MNSTCAGCEYLKFEVFPHGRLAARCFDPEKRMWGEGRVVGNPNRAIMPERIERPAWCRKEQE